MKNGEKADNFPTNQLFNIYQDILIYYPNKNI